MNLQQYAESMPESALLGYISWYELTDPNIKHADLVTAMTKAGFTKREIPGAPRRGDVFKRACRYSEQKRIPITENQYANVLVRKVASETDQVENHVVIEVVDKEGHRLDYQIAMKLQFNRIQNKLYVSRLPVPLYLDKIVDDAFNEFHRQFEKAQTTIDPQVIRLALRQRLDRMGATQVRNRGSVYFIPRTQKESVNQLEELFRVFNNNSLFHSIPLPDTSKQREMVQAAFDSDIHDRAESLIEKLNGLIAKDKVGDKEWENISHSYKQIKEQKEEYESLLEWNALRSDTELQVLDQKFKQVMLGVS